MVPRESYVFQTLPPLCSWSFFHGLLKLARVRGRAISILSILINKLDIITCIMVISKAIKTIGRCLCRATSLPFYSFIINILRIDKISTLVNS